MRLVLTALCILAFTVGGAEGKVTKVAPPPPIPIGDNSLPMQCGPVKDVLAMLKDKYHEKQTAVGMISEQIMFALYANIDTGSWTSLLISSDGGACMTGSGKSFAYTLMGKGA